MPGRNGSHRERIVSARRDDQPDPVREALRLTQLSHGGG
jgi:hypothetical protein